MQKVHILPGALNLLAKSELIRKIGSNRLLTFGKVAVICENPWKILAEKSANSDWRRILKIAQTYFERNF